MDDETYNQLGIDELRDTFLKYTRKAFQLLPALENPRILDIGCGTGNPTLALADLTRGAILGIDIDRAAITLLQEKIQHRGLASRVQAIHCSIEKLSFPPESFDIIWEEGVLHLLDLQKVLTPAKRVLKTGGFFVLHETKTWVEQHRDQFLNNGFYFWGHFLLPEKSWWTEYYAILEQRIQNLLKKQEAPLDPTKFDQYIHEIALVKPDPGKYDCGFYILRNRGYDNQ